MIDLRDIHSLSDFQRRTREHIGRLRETGRPAVLTVNGKAELVVQDAESYQDLFVGRVRTEDPRRSPTATPPLGPDPVVEAYKRDVDRTLLRQNLARAVDERLAGLAALQRLAEEARRAGDRGTGGAG